MRRWIGTRIVIAGHLVSSLGCLVLKKHQAGNYDAVTGTFLAGKVRYYETYCVNCGRRFSTGEP